MKSHTSSLSVAPADGRWSCRTGTALPLLWSWSHRQKKVPVYCALVLSSGPHFLLIPFLPLNKEMPSPPASEGCFEQQSGQIHAGHHKQHRAPHSHAEHRQRQEAAALLLELFLAALGGLYQMSLCPLPGAAHEHWASLA